MSSGAPYRKVLTQFHSLKYHFCFVSKNKLSSDIPPTYARTIHFYFTAHTLQLLMRTADDVTLHEIKQQSATFLLFIFPVFVEPQNVPKQSCSSMTIRNYIACNIKLVSVSHLHANVQQTKRTERLLLVKVLIKVQA